jgi:N-sulfoglucosamine sulfohydrolase
MTTLPNILYIHSHDTGRWIQPYGYDIPTPNYQRLAEQGMLFRQAFCAAPTCSPSRAALLTGASPHSAGMLGLAHRGFSQIDPRQHLLTTLKNAGYFAALAGLQHVFTGDELPKAGYDFLRPGGQPAEKVAADFIQQRTAKRGQPFFLDVGFFETHRSGSNTGFDNEKAGEPEPDGRYIRPPAPLPDVSAIRRDAADYRLCAARLDRKVGVVLDALEKSGHAENTLVVLTTDHGPAFPGMKCNLTDHGMGVLLILSGSGIPKGDICDAMVSQVDLFPTLCDLLKIDKPAWLEGKSLAPLLGGSKTEINEEVFAEVTYHAAYEPMRAVRTKRWKYIRRWGDHAKQPVLPNCDDSPSKDEWLVNGWRTHPVAAEALYDLCFDPQENQNLVDHPDHTDTLAEMRGRLKRWMEHTKDPLLAGSVAAPSGSRVNDVDGLSPGEQPRLIS